MFQEPKLYDSEGKEIIIPEGHQVVCGKDKFCFVPVESNLGSVKFVYKPPKD